jgi:excisionase family DNA binding protein
MRTPNPTLPDSSLRIDGLAPRYVRPKDAARISGLSRSAIFAALWSGELRAFRKGRSWLIAIEDLDRWIRGEEA